MSFLGSLFKNKKNEDRSEEFETLAFPHLDALYGFALSLARNQPDAEDLVQETVLKAYKSFSQFEVGTNMKAWLFRILKNTFISNVRKKSSKVEVQPDSDDPDFSFFSAVKANADETNPVEAEALLDPEKLEHVLGDEVKNAFESLPPDYREVVYLCDIQGLSYQDIADILKIPVGTVRSRLSRARSAMQKLLWDYAKDKGLWRGKGK